MESRKHSGSRPARFALAAAIVLTLGSTTAISPQKNASRDATFQTLSAQATAALNADKVDEAIPLLRKALSINPHWVEGWWSLGTAFYDQDGYAEASLAFQKVVTLTTKNGTAHAMLGLCQFELGDDAAALQNIETSKELGTDADPQLRDVIFYHEGVLLQRAGKFVGAQKAFSSLCLGGTRSHELLQAFGMAALQMRDQSFPPPRTEAALVVEHVGNAACLAAQKDFNASRAEFERVVQAYPRFPFAHYAFGRELLEMQDVPAAVVQFKSELDLGHDRLLPLLQIAAAEYKIDSHAALPFAQEAVSLAPQSPFAHFLLGLLLMDTGSYEKAVTELEFARKGMPDQNDVLWSLASAYAMTGRVDAAARLRRQVVALGKKPGVPSGNSAVAETPDVNVTVPSQSGAAPEH